MSQHADDRDPEAAWRRVEELGAFVPVERRVRVDGADVEIVKTYGDCTLTALFFRAPAGLMIHALPTWPPEIVGGASGGMVGDLHVMEYPPVLPERSSIRVSIGRRPTPWDEDAIDIPVDRARTERFDRLVAEPVPQIESVGVRVQLVSLASGLIRTAAELLIDATDEGILAVELGQAPFRPHVAAGPGPAALWRDWHPPPQEAGTVRRVERGIRVTMTAAAEATVSARRLTPEELAKLPPPRERSPDWRAWAPGREELTVQGASGRGGPPPERPRIEPILYFDALLEASEAIGLSLEQLWAYRFAGARATIPSPQAERSVTLRGTTLDGAGCRVELLGWDPVGPNGFRLTARCDPPDAWPDLRITEGAASASLWCEPPYQGELSASLPLSHASLFEGPTVDVALRMVARRVEPIALVARLTPSGAKERDL
jgi:hypothetical protein